MDSIEGDPQLSLFDGLLDDNDVQHLAEMDALLIMDSLDMDDLGIGQHGDAPDSPEIEDVAPDPAPLRMSLVQAPLSLLSSILFHDHFGDAGDDVRGAIQHMCVTASLQGCLRDCVRLFQCFEQAVTSNILLKAWKQEVADALHRGLIDFDSQQALYSIANARRKQFKDRVRQERSPPPVSVALTADAEQLLAQTNTTSLIFHSAIVLVPEKSRDLVHIMINFMASKENMEHLGDSFPDVFNVMEQAKHCLFGDNEGTFEAWMEDVANVLRHTTNFHFLLAAIRGMRKRVRDRRSQARRRAGARNTAAGAASSDELPAKRAKRSSRC